MIKFCISACVFFCFLFFCSFSCSRAALSDGVVDTTVCPAKLYDITHNKDLTVNLDCEMEDYYWSGGRGKVTLLKYSSAQTDTSGTTCLNKYTIRIVRTDASLTQYCCVRDLTLKYFAFSQEETAPDFTTITDSIDNLHETFWLVIYSLTALLFGLFVYKIIRSAF